MSWGSSGGPLLALPVFPSVFLIGPILSSRILSFISYSFFFFFVNKCQTFYSIKLTGEGTSKMLQLIRRRMQRKDAHTGNQEQWNKLAEMMQPWSIARGNHAQSFDPTIRYILIIFFLRFRVLKVSSRTIRGREPLGGSTSRDTRDFRCLSQACHHKKAE